MTTGEYLWGKNKALQSEITSEMLANTGYHGREKYTSLEVVIFLKAFLQLVHEPSPEMWLKIYFRSTPP